MMRLLMLAVAMLAGCQGVSYARQATPFQQVGLESLAGFQEYGENWKIVGG